MSCCPRLASLVSHIPLLGCKVSQPTAALCGKACRTSKFFRLLPPHHETISFDYNSLANTTDTHSHGLWPYLGSTCIKHKYYYFSVINLIGLQVIINSTYHTLLHNAHVHNGSTKPSDSKAIQIKILHVICLDMANINL